MMTKEEFDKEIRRVTSPLPGNKAYRVKYKLAVKQKFDNLSVLDFCRKAFSSISKEKWLEKLNDKQLFLNGEIANLNDIVRGGNIVEHYSELIEEPSVSTQIELISSNRDFLVLNKPSPLPVHPGGRFNKNTLIEILKKAFPQHTFKLVHRLDANTTGLVLVGLTDKSTALLASLFESQKISKEYLALVNGVFSEDNVVSTSKIGDNTAESGSREVVNDGLSSCTDFQVVKRFSDANKTLLKVFPKTGRTNQIRLHLADLGYPIVGDIGYEESDYFKSNPLTYSNDQLFLHAYKLTFKYLNNEYCFTAGIPEKFKQYL